MNPILTSTPLGWVRSPRYWNKDYLYPCPNAVVFQAKVAAVPTTATYLEIEFDTVSVGSFSDIQIGQTVIISATSDHMDYLHMGRVADTATSDTLPVNEDAYPLDTAFYITVTDSYRELPKVRAGALVDGRKPYENLPPAIKNMRSAYHKWSATTASFPFAPVGQAMADGATISSYAWYIPGATYTTGSASTQNITVTVPHGHRHGRLTVTDSNGVSQWMVFEIFVDDPTSPTLALTSADRLSLTRTLSGHHCTFTAYKNVKTSDILDGTRMTVVSKPRYSGGDPALDSVRFVGYLVKESNSTNSPNDKSVSFELAGLWERAGQLPFNAIAIRDKATPAAWDEIDKPTTQRVVWHILTRYSVLPNLAAIDFDVTDDTWYGGDRNVSSNSLGDACEQALSEINAVLLGDPSGQMYLRRHAFFLSQAEQDALDTVLTLTSSDMRNLSFQRSHDDPVGRVVIGFAGFYTNGTAPKIGRGRAPTVTLGTSPEVREINNQLMKADQSETDLLAEVEQRTAAHLGVANLPYDALGLEARDGFAWMTPSVSQWVPVTLATGLTTRGRTFSAVKHLLTSVQIDYDNRANTDTVKFELTPLPGPQSALVVANLTPTAQALDEIVVPIQGAFSGLNSPSSLNSPDTTTPNKFTEDNMGGIGSTIPADRQADKARRTPANGSRMVPIGLWVSTPVNAGFLSVLGADYTFTVSGYGVVGGGVPAIVLTPNNLSLPNVVNYLGKVGTDDLWRVFSYPNSIYGNVDIASSVSPFYINNLTPESGGAWQWVSAPYTTTLTDAIGLSLTVGFGGYFVGPGQFVIQVGATSGSGGTTPGTTYGDALFLWELDADGNEINKRLNPDNGLEIDGSVAATLLYNKSHEYTFTRTGTGSQFSIVFNDAYYPDNQRVPLLVTIKGPNAGT